MKLTPEERTSSIINLLLSNTAFLSVDEITGALDISRRNAYYAIDEINRLLDKAGAEEIHKDYGKGMYLDIQQKNILSKYFSGRNSIDIYSLSVDERIACIFCEMYLSTDSCKISCFEERFKLSRYTVISDINDLKERSKKFDLEIVFDNKHGYTVCGDEFNRRKGFFYFFSMIYSAVAEHQSLFKGFSFVDHGIQRTYEKFGDLAIEGLDCYDCSVMAMSCLIADVQKHREHQISFDKAIEEVHYIENSPEREYISSHFPKLPKDENLYFSFYLTCSRIGRNGTVVKNSHMIDIARKMAETFYLLSAVNVGDEQFIHQLSLHLDLAYLRYKYGIAIDNPVIDQIKMNYNSYYGIVRQCAKTLEDYIGAAISESEIGFLTLYFAGRAIQKKKNIPRVETIIICLNGLATSYLLKNEIENLDSRIAVIDCIGLKEYLSSDYKADLVLSTVQLTPKNGDRFILIHPILTFDDKMAIGNVVSKVIFGTGGSPTYSKVLDVVRPYISNERIGQASATLKTLYEDSQNDSSAVTKNEFFLPEFVQIAETDDDWDRLIRRAAVPLIHARYIKGDYADEIINNINEYGSYMVFQNGYLLGHSSPERSKKLGLSFLRLKKEKQIKENVVSKILIITPNDYSSHLRYLYCLLDLFKNEEMNRQIMEADDPEIIYNIVNSFFKE